MTELRTSTTTSSDFLYLVQQIQDTLQRSDLEKARILFRELQARFPNEAKTSREITILLRDLRRLQRRRLRELEEVVETKINGNEDELDEAERMLDEMEYMLAGALDEEREGLEKVRSRLSQWRDQVARRRETIRIEKELERLHAELEQRWHEAEKLEEEGLGGASLIGIYRRIYEHAVGEAERIGHPRAEAFAEQARKRYNDVRARHEMASTRQQEGRFKELLDELQTRDENEQVRIQKDLFDQNSEELISVKEARDIVARQARDYARQKASEYISTTRKYLEEHKPEAAQKELNKVFDLFMLDDEMLARARGIMEREVKPAYAERQKAKAKIERARRAAPEAAWKLLAEAEAIDPYTPGLKEARDDLVRHERIQRVLENKLSLATKALQNNPPDWETAQKLSQEIKAIAQQHPALENFVQGAEALESEAVSWKGISVQIDRLLEEARAQESTNMERAFELVRTAVEALGAKAERFPALQQYKDRVEAQLNFQKLSQELASMVTSDSLLQVENAIQRCDSVLDSGDVLHREELELLKERLEYHRDFLRAKALYDNPHRTPSDELTARKLLEGVVQANADDRQAAQRMLEQIRTDEKNRQDIKQRLEKAASAYQREEWEQVYRLLKPIRNASEQARQLYDKVVEAWEKTLISSIRKQLKRSTLDEDSLNKLVDTLDEIGAEKAGYWRSIVESRTAAQRAQKLMQSKNPNWEAIVDYWRKAVSADPDNIHYQDALVEAEKKKAFYEINRLSDPREKVARFADLAHQYPTDLEIKQWLLNAYLTLISSLDDYDEIERTARKAQIVVEQIEYLRTQQSVTHALATKLDHTIKHFREIVDIAQQRRLIEEKLKPDHMVDAWKDALEQKESLFRQYGNTSHAQSLKSWWRRVREQALEEAKQRLHKLKNEGASEWNRVLPAAQILVLNPENNDALQEIQSIYHATWDLETKLKNERQDKTALQLQADTGRNEDIIAIQLKRIDDLWHRLSLAEQVVMNFGSQFERPEKLRNVINASKALASSTRSELEEFRRRINSARAYMNQAKVDPSYWTEFQTILQEIAESGYKDHVATAELVRKREEIQRTQNELRTLEDQLLKAIEKEETTTALHKIERIKAIDPKNEYGVQSRIQARIPFGDKMLRGLGQIEQFLQRQQEQLSRLTAWLPHLPIERAAWLKAFPKDETISLLHWDMVQPELDEMVARGDFQECYTTLEACFKGNTEAPREFRNEFYRSLNKDHQFYDQFLAFDPAIQYLSHPPYATSDLLSAKARLLWDYGQELLQEVEADVDQANQRQREIERIEMEWANAWSAFAAAIGRVDALMNLPPWRRMFRSEEIQEAKIQALEAYNRCRSICPQHPDLVGWDGHDYLGGVS